MTSRGGGAHPGELQQGDGVKKLIDVLIACVIHARAPVIRDALSGKPSIRSVGLAVEPEAALLLTATSAPHVVVVDDLMFHKLQNEWARAVSKSLPSLIVVHPPAKRWAEVRAFFDMGVNATLPEDVSPQALLGAVWAVAEDALVKNVASSMAKTRPETTDSYLTSREREVLEGVASAWSNSEIAEEFTISTETVKSHVSTLLRKLDCRNRIELVVRAHREGIVGPPLREGGLLPRSGG